MLFGEVTQENVYITHSVGLHAEICQYQSRYIAYQRRQH